MSALSVEILRQETPDGLELSLRRFKAESARLQLLLAHGYAEHCGRYEHVAKFFQQWGFEVWAFDFRGHGSSRGRRGYIDSFSDYLTDIDTVCEEFNRHNSGAIPQVIIGHSMGGLVLANWLKSREIQGSLVRPLAFGFSSPFFGMKLQVAPWKRFLGRALSGIWPSFSLPSELRVEQLMADAEMQQRWREDKLIVHKIPARWLTETLKAQAAIHSTFKLDYPIAIMHGADDPIASPETAKSCLERWDAPKKFWHELSGLRHEIFNESDREKVFSLYVDWLKSLIPERSRGESKSATKKRKA